MWFLLFEQNMNGPPHRRWMYNRLLRDRSGYTQEFLDGVNEFDQFARTQTEFLNGGKYRCPCAKCRNRVYLTPDEVKMHLMYKGFVQGYWFWISHGEIEPQEYGSGYQNSEIPEVGGSSNFNNDYSESYIDRMEDMVDDAVIANQNVREEGSSTCREPFYNMVQAAQQPLYDGFSTHSELSAAV